MRQKANQPLTAWQRVNQSSSALLKQSLRSTHSRIVTCGVLICACYLPFWFGILWKITLNGSSDGILNCGFIYIALRDLLKDQRAIAIKTAPDEDRTLGHLLILGGVVTFPFCFASVSLQAFLCMLILIGIALSSWGVRFLQKYLVPVMLLLVSVYPDLGFLANTVRRTLMPNQLESFMAWLASLIFNAIGQPAISQNQFLSLSTELSAGKAVEVASGCSGFDMAFTLAGVGLILGLFFRQPWSKTGTLMLVAVMLALVTNVPRIMLLAVAVVYWGQESFEFWHGPVGGQIIASILITAYYYIAMALIEQKTVKSK